MKSLIWNLPIRFFHWLLAISFTITFILADFEEYRNLHFAFGIFVGILILFRLLYGLIGPKYSHFRDFPIGFKKQVEFIKSFFSSPKVYAGHNPVASIVMLCIFIVGILSSITGYFLYSADENILNFSIDKESLEVAHKITVVLLLILVFIHLAGIVADYALHRKIGTLKSIFMGYKNIEAEEAKLTRYHIVFSIFWFITPFIFLYFAYSLQLSKQENDKNHYEKTEQTESEDDD